MVEITETSQKIFEFAMRMREARLEEFPWAYMLTYREAIEFYHDLRDNPFDFMAMYSLIPMTVERERFNDFYPCEPPPPPHPRTGHVMWCTYKGVPLAIKGDLDA